MPLDTLKVKWEAPWAYKDIGLVLQTQVHADIVRRVAELHPIITVKG